MKKILLIITALVFTVRSLTSFAVYEKDFPPHSVGKREMPLISFTAADGE